MSTTTDRSASDVSDISQGEVNEKELRANFASGEGTGNNETKKPQASPLLSSTPPTVSKALIRAYPYLLTMNKFISIVTWTNDDYWINIIIILVFALSVMYFEQVVIWLGHLIIVGFIILYASLNNKIIEEADLHPSLDEVIQALTNTCIKADKLLDPIISLSLSGYDIKRLLFTTVFLTPVYLIMTFLLVTPRTLLLICGLFLLSYHSSYMAVTRKMVWKIKLTRLLCFYLTGLDFLQARNHSLFAAAFAKVQKNAGHSLNPLSSESNRPVRFTYVIYENQRRWLGIGWTSNLLTYERTPWTDEFLNESSSIDSFNLPNPENHQNYTFGSEQSLQLSMNNAKWRWVDKTWRLDLTNDGAITLPNNKRSKTTANPNSDEGFIYYDNTWKRPSSEDSYSKYTRRRRWIRTAELVFDNDNSTVNSRFNSSNDKKKKSLRFAEPEPNMEPEEETETEGDTQEKLSPDQQSQQSHHKPAVDLTQVADVLEKLNVAPSDVSKEILEPVLQDKTHDNKDNSDIEDIKSVNPISDVVKNQPSTPPETKKDE